MNLRMVTYPLRLMLTIVVHSLKVVLMPVVIFVLFREQQIDHLRELSLVV